MRRSVEIDIVIELCMLIYSDVIARSSRFFLLLAMFFDFLTLCSDFCYFLKTRLVLKRQKLNKQCILCQTLRFLNGNQDTSRAPNNNKQPCSCQTSLRNLLFHLVQRISLHFKSPDLYLSCTKKVFPKFLLLFQCQASFQSEQFGSYDYAPRSLSLVACSLSSQRSHMLMQKKKKKKKKTPVQACTIYVLDALPVCFTSTSCRLNC